MGYFGSYFLLILGLLRTCWSEWIIFYIQLEPFEAGPRASSLLVYQDRAVWAGNIEGMAECTQGRQKAKGGHCLVCWGLWVYIYICDPLWEKVQFGAKIQNCVTRIVRKRNARCIQRRKPHLRNCFRSSAVRNNARALPCALFRDIACGNFMTQYTRRQRPQLRGDAAGATSGRSTSFQREKVDTRL